MPIFSWKFHAKGLLRVNFLPLGGECSPVSEPSAGIYGWILTWCQFMLENNSFEEANNSDLGLIGLYGYRRGVVSSRSPHDIYPVLQAFDGH